MGFGFLGMFLFWGVLLVLLAGGAALVLRQSSGAALSTGQRGRTAPHLLDQRLARGEISADEYYALRAKIGR